MPSEEQQRLLEETQVRLAQADELDRINQLLQEHHYLGGIRPVGERLYYLACDGQGEWLAILVFNSAAKHLKDRDRWIGWSAEQRRRRLALVVNNSRFLLLPEPRVPNLGTRVLRLVQERLSADWMRVYGHPVLVAESFVDPERFCGTVYTAQGWEELGQTDGWGRRRRDYYLKHDKPKRLLVRELCRGARRSLQAAKLKPALAMVEAKAPPRCTHRIEEIRSMREHFKAIADYRGRVGSYPLWSLLTIVLLGVLCGAPRGQKDLAKFARGFSQGQRRALGIRVDRRGKYPTPSQSTFCRLFQGVDGDKLEERILAIQAQVRGQPPAEDLIVMDGKVPKHGGGQGVLTAVSVPGQYYLGSAMVESDKTNEIPVARQLIDKLDLEGRRVALDALHTQSETARTLVMEAGADYLLTVKDNQPTLHQTIKTLIEAPSESFPPWGADADPGQRAGA